MNEKMLNAVKQNMDVVKDILLIFEIREDVEKKLPFKLLPPPRPVRIMREIINKRVGKIESAAIPLTLVFIASSLESYLKDVSGIEKRWFYDRIEDYKDQVGPDLTKNAHIFRIKRNVILHNNGVVDERAKNDFVRIGCNDYSVGQKLVLTEREIREHIANVEEFCDIVFQDSESS